VPTRRDPAGAAEQVRVTLDSVVRRVGLRSALRAATWGAGAMAIVLAISIAASASIRVRLGSAVVAGSVAAGVAFAGTRRERTRDAAAAAIERVYPSLRNLAVTAQELIAEPDRTRPYMWARVMQAAAHALTGIDAARVIPLARDMAALTVAIVAATAGLLAGKPLVASSGVPIGNPSRDERAPAAGDIIIDIAPPGYTARAMVHLRNPVSIEALAGSDAAIRVAGIAQPLVRVNGSSLASDGDTVRATLSESGFVAIDAGGIHRLMPLTVIPDAAPSVRVTVPGKDLRVADANATIPIHATAADDIGLRAFELRYTIVSGGGEQFSFKEGTLSAAVTKDSARAWTTAASLSLAALKLEPGDALIYRAVAADARPGSSGEASSDTFFVEVAGPGDVALEGVDMPPERERYALSQAMIVLKIQRLIARQPGMPRADVEEAAGGIAAEQRAVRANFIFLLGGEVEDEVVEAEASHEIQEGRLANQARREIVAATLSMRKVEESLAAVAVRPALPPAQEAVRALQRAFGRSRYLLRALPARIRLDPSRRLSGDLASAHDWARDLAPAAEDRTIAASRRAVAETAAIADTLVSDNARARLEQLAEDVLAIAPGAADLQGSARRLMQARDLLAKGDAAQARSAMQDAIAPLLSRAQHGRMDVPTLTRDVARLAGAAVNGGGAR
jgi:hypothetical protein